MQTEILPVGAESVEVTVAWEPCWAFEEDPEHGCCATCGWAPDDHELTLPAAA